MIDQFTKVFYRTVKAAKEHDIIISSGGTRSSKSFSILQLLIIIAGTKSNQLISVVSETLPHLKRGVVRDFQTILGEDFHFSQWNKSELIYHFPNGSKIEFFSADKPDKLRGAARDYLFINEANRVDYESYLQLAARTRRKTFLDFNPVSRFWAHDLGVPVIHSTYKDNPFLTKKQIQFIESQKHNENWWRVYGLGQIGKLENLVFPDYKLVDGLPDTYKWRVFGLDFGFKNDPSALVEVRYSDGKLWLKEWLYDYGLTNQDIAKKIKEFGFANYQIICDGAEPKSVEELKRAGIVNAIGHSHKAPIKYGIQLMEGYELNVTKDSQNLITELKNYMYKKDRLTGKATNDPIDAYNHAIDAVRYVCVEKFGRNRKTVIF